MAQAPLSFTFCIAAPIEKVWNGFVSKEAGLKTLLETGRARSKVFSAAAVATLAPGGLCPGGGDA
jgi:hypothetical protein